ncbi:ROK family protein [Microtetraspora niveoalba]|uniref:ROK family protein n=1 Tax=Microtetraspora niveoalba TaxID=46175 RepID=UPI00082C9B71|nr:ROK family protein [Microtetraspora niveoalba]
MPRSQGSKAPVASPAAAAVFTTVLTRGPASRVDVCRLTGLSSAAVTKAARPLIEAGYLRELAPTERTAPGAGRPASPLAIAPEREYFVGIKITGDDLIGVVTDLGSRIVTSQHRPVPGFDVRTDASASSMEPADVVAAIAALTTELLDEHPDFRERAHRLGVAISGDVDRDTGTVRYSPFLGWRDVPLAALLDEATGLTTTLENDVKALAVAEHWFGEGVGASSFALVTVGTGIGSAFVVNGGLVSGAFGVSGEIGHVPIGVDGPRCHCGATGCLEALASTQALLTEARRATGVDDLTIDQAVDRARSGDQVLRKVFAIAGRAIGLGLAVVANLLGPESLVVSGEGLDAYDLFEESIREAFSAQAYGSAGRCGLTIRPLPFEEWARGAATVAVQSMVGTPG